MRGAGGGGGGRGMGGGGWVGGQECEAEGGWAAVTGEGGRGRIVVEGVVCSGGVEYGAYGSLVPRVSVQKRGWGRKWSGSA